MILINTIYLDNASTTKEDERVLAEMLPYFTEIYGNASSNHDFGKQAKNAIEEYRKQLARLINYNSNEIIFSSETDSINLSSKVYFSNKN